MQGIYKIKNTVNGKVYIGQSTDIVARWAHHMTYLNENIHGNPHLQNAWNKYGKDKFEFSIIEECEYDKLTEREQYWIDYYGGRNSNKTYNLRDANIGGHLSDITRKRISEAGLGKEPWNKGLTKDTDERIKNYSEKLSNNHLPEEICKRISETVSQLHKDGVYDYKSMAKKGVETRKRNGTVRKDKGVKRGNYSEEWCSNISKGKLEANRIKREKGLPLRIQEKKPVPMKTSICEFCGKEFQQRQCWHKKYCCRVCYQNSRKKV